MANKLLVQSRHAKGKGPARRLRATGHVLGAIYGHGKQNIDVYVDSRGFERFLGGLKSETELISIQIDGEAGSEKLALIKEIQYHPVSEKLLHVDFFEINPNEQIHVAVPLHFRGVPVGVSDQGGMIEFLQRELHVVCLPRDMPTSIEVDISGLAAGAALHVSDLTLPRGVITREEPRKALIHVTLKVQREEIAPAAEGVATVEAPTPTI
jgi:large subunit ribosomal protein L25